MPWESVTVEAKRQEFASLANAEGANVSELCRRFGISRKTGYKWLARAIAPAEQDVSTRFADRSRKPLSSPLRTHVALETKVLGVRDAHPAWGGRKISCVLQRDQEIALPASTVNSILKRHGRISQTASQAAQAWQRFEHAAPNDLWQMDFKGHFPTGAGRCHPLTIIDDHSRYNIVLAACANERGDTVRAQMQRAFETYGLPHRINTDNGSPWGNRGDPYLTTLGVWLVRLGIRVGRSTPGHPQTNGKDERFHRSLKAEVLAGRAYADIAATQIAFDHWRPVYNDYRPHEALAMAVPSTRYCISPRRFPATLPPIEYGAHDAVRKVQYGGWLSYKNQPIRVGAALHGQPVAIRPTNQDGVMHVFFCHQKILTLNLNQPKNL